MSMSSVKIYLLGSPRLERDVQVAEMDTRKAIALLAYLALSGKEQQRDMLAGLLWPDYDQAGARAALRRTLSTLHKALGQSGLAISREAIGFKPEAGFWLDVSAFQALAAGCERHAPQASPTCAECLTRLEQASQVYTADFMEGFNLRDSAPFDEWQFTQREALRGALAKALEKLAQGLAAGDPAAAIERARRWLALDPLMEEPQRVLMRLYAQAGQRSAAVRQYRECVRVLEDELGVAPLEETTRLYQEILSGKWDPDRAPIETPPSQPTAEKPPPHIFSPSRRIVGRAQEWASLVDAFARPGSDGQFIAIEGEAGIGKTRLAEEYLATMTSQGGTVIRGRCYAGESDLAYAPFLTSLGEALAAPWAAARLAGLPATSLSTAARLLPGLAELYPDLPPAPPSEGAGAQARFFEALRQIIFGLLASGPRGALFFDDLHWADSASLDLLAFLAHRLRGSRVQLLCAWRSEASPSVDRLNRILAEARRDGLGLRLSLARFGQTEIAELARTLAEERPGLAEGLEERLFQESEGLPFFAVEYLNAIAAGARSWSPPAGVRELLHQRLTALSGPAHQLAATGAVIGRSFDFDTLQAVSGRSELETVEGLEDLIGRGIVVEIPGKEGAGSSRYDFTHEKLRAQAYEEASLARRRLLHQRTAQHLASLAIRQKDGEALAGITATHFQAAGKVAQAGEYFRRAGEHERRLHANTEALAHFNAALASLPPGAPELPGIHEAIGDLHTLGGDYAAAIASYQAATAFCSPECLAHLMHKLGAVYQRRGEWEQAEGAFREADEAALGRSEPAWRAMLYADWSLTAHLGGFAARAEDLAGRALQQAEASGEPGAQAQALNVLGVLARANGDLGAAIHFLERSLEAASRLPDGGLRAAALNNLGRVYQECGMLEPALRHTRLALDLCAQMGDRHRQAALHNSLADLYHASGREEESMAELKQAVSLFAEIGGNPELPEIWKLTEW